MGIFLPTSAHERNASCDESGDLGIPGGLSDEDREKLLRLGNFVMNACFF